MEERISIFVAFLAAAVLTAGVFGIVHDQISYTISNEYFTTFKFIQFQLVDPALPERLRVAIVGFLASWWMGAPLGILTGVVGFMHKTPDQMRKVLLLSLPLICAFVLLIALAGLAYGIYKTTNLDLSNYDDWFVPQSLEHPRRFICVGYMHNSAYLGGAAAIPMAWLFHILHRRLATHSLGRKPV